MKRYAAKVVDGNVVDVLVVADGEQGDETIAALELVAEPDVRPGIGWTWNGKKFSPPPPPPATWDDVRRQRNLLLAACDWTQIADAPVDREAWAAYRQQLRDVPQNFPKPDKVVWPTPPEVTA